MRQSFITFMAAACLAFVVLTASSGVSADAPAVLQLKPLPMPAITEKGYRGRMTFTPYIKVTGSAAVERLCGRLPRLMDAVLVALEDNPVRLADVAGDVAARHEDMKTLADTSVGTGVFQAFYLVAGSIPRGEGTELVDIAGATRDCQPIKALPDATAATAPAVSPAVAEENTASAVRPSPLSAAELARAEAELMAETPVRKPFPGEPQLHKAVPEQTIIIAIVVIGVAGIMMVIGSYIGYQVAKIRRERRRKERRQARKDRRSGADRRLRNDGAPATGERRKADERRKTGDRRLAKDRRDKRDRRAEAKPEDER